MYSDRMPEYSVDLLGVIPSTTLKQRDMKIEAGSIRSADKSSVQWDGPRKSLSKRKPLLGIAK